MRELKFRIYDFDANVWVKNVSDFTVSSLYERCPSYHKVMQFTGLEDKNGKDIFEGDIIEDTDYEGIKIIGSIVYTLGAFYIDWNNTYPHLLLSIGTPTIIGNIHENKELLNIQTIQR